MVSSTSNCLAGRASCVLLALAAFVKGIMNAPFFWGATMQGFDGFGRSTTTAFPDGGDIPGVGGADADAAVAAGVAGSIGRGF